MRNLSQQERKAIEAVAKQFSAKWEEGSVAAGTHLVVAGKRIAVDIKTFKRHGTNTGNAARPRLRFDKVATRVIERLQVALGETVPEGMTVALTITAPIRVPAKTAASLEEKIRALVRRGSLGPDKKETICGNRVRIRLLRDASARASRVIGFVHNSDSDPLLLLNMTREVFDLVGTEADGRAPRSVGDRWLVVTGAGNSALLEAYHYIHAQLRIATGFKKILMVFDDGRVGVLTDEAPHGTR